MKDCFTSNETLQSDTGAGLMVNLSCNGSQKNGFLWRGKAIQTKVYQNYSFYCIFRDTELFSDFLFVT